MCNTTTTRTRYSRQDLTRLRQGINTKAIKMAVNAYGLVGPATKFSDTHNVIFWMTIRLSETTASKHATNATHIRPRMLK